MIRMAAAGSGVAVIVMTVAFHLLVMDLSIFWIRLLRYLGV